MSMYYVIQSEPFLKDKVIGCTKYNASENEGNILLRVFADTIVFPQTLRLVKEVAMVESQWPLS